MPSLPVAGVVHYGGVRGTGTVGWCPLKMRIAAMEACGIEEGAVVEVGWDRARMHLIREPC